MELNIEKLKSFEFEGEYQQVKEFLNKISPKLEKLKITAMSKTSSDKFLGMLKKLKNLVTLKVKNSDISSLFSFDSQNVFGSIKVLSLSSLRYSYSSVFVATNFPNLRKISLKYVFAQDLDSLPDLESIKAPYHKELSPNRFPHLTSFSFNKSNDLNE